MQNKNILKNFNFMLKLKFLQFTIYILFDLKCKKYESFITKTNILLFFFFFFFSRLNTLLRMKIKCNWSSRFLFREFNAKFNSCPSS